jgi:hypothetical protein
MHENSDFSRLDPDEEKVFKFKNINRTYALEVQNQAHSAL